MSGLLYRLGRGAALHPRRTLALWALAATVVFALGSVAGGTPHDDWDVPSAPAQHGIEQLRAHVPGAGNAGAQVVVHDAGGEALAPSALRSLATRLGGMPHVVDVSRREMGPHGRADAARLTGALASWANVHQYLSFAETPVDVESAYADGTWRQLAGIRSAVDPNGTFVANHPVPRLYEDGRTRA